MAKIYQKSNKTFINPYNFVSLGKKCKREDGNPYEKRKNDKDSLSGWIECELMTKTPIFVPNTTNDDLFKVKSSDEKINSYDFFSYEDLSNSKDPSEPKSPVIPGSEIRGVIRSAFETVTNSCLSTTDDEQILYKRTTSVGCPGMLLYDYDSNKWKIQKCVKYRINEKKVKSQNSLKSLKEGEKVYFTDDNNKALRKVSHFEKKYFSVGNKKTKEGYFHSGESFVRKKHEAIYEITDGKFSISEKDVKNLISNLKLYRDKTVNRDGKHTRYPKLTSIKDTESLKDFIEMIGAPGLPIYYKEQAGKYYLSPAQIGREVYHNKLKDILKEKGDFNPCSKKNNLCEGCLLFGMVGDGGEAVASRVRFTDAKLNDEKQSGLFHKPVILPELASPKVSATEFYVKKPGSNESKHYGNPQLWNYDYAGNWNNKKRGTPEIEVISYKPEIKGRKYYWHHNGFCITPDMENYYKNERKDINRDNTTNRNVAIRPLKKDTKFTFKVYFNDITEDELKKLCWTLTIGKRETHAHKIGMGKPVGLGSVKISLSDIRIRRFDLSDDKPYTIESQKSLIGDIEKFDHEKLGCDKNTFKEFLKISNYKNPICDPGVKIEYPNNKENSKENFKWFAANKMINTTGTKPVICQTLPEILDKDVSLQKYFEKEQERKQRKQRKK